MVMVQVLRSHACENLQPTILIQAVDQKCKFSIRVGLTGASPFSYVAPVGPVEQILSYWDSQVNHICKTFHAGSDGL